MNRSLSYDWVAGFYDSSRDFPEPIATRGIQAILDIAGPGARILDVGTGTGRFSVPLLMRGADLIGCDLSAKMMGRLREKYPTARLVQADASRLPFQSGHFDALTTSHVMHLVGPWREALCEYRRVLTPGGIYINARTERKGPSAQRQIRDFWQGRVAASGVSTRRPGIRDEKELQGELSKMGANLRRVEVIHFTRTYTLRDAIDGIARRTHSDAVNIPDDVFAASIRDLRAWADRELGDIDKPLDEEVCFVLDVARFE